MSDKGQTKMMNPSREGGQEAQTTAIDAMEKIATKELGSSYGPEVDELERQLKEYRENVAKLEARLEHETNKALAKSWRDSIRSFNKAIKIRQDELHTAKSKVIMSKIGVVMNFKFDDGSVEKRKPAYIKYNRKINRKRVDEFKQIIRDHFYYDCYPIVMEDASEFKMAHSDVEICDAYGNEIPDDELNGYSVILDGQHRQRAHAELYLSGTGSDTISGVKKIEVNEDIGEFLKAINPSGSWSKQQQIEVCALTCEDKYRNLCSAVRSIIDRGFNYSTASEIYIGTPLTSRQVSALLEGKPLKNAITYNIEDGNEFIKCCEDAGISVKYLTKRYFIEGYNDFKKVRGESIAKKVLHNLPNFTDDQLKAVTSKDVFNKMLCDVDLNDDNND